MTLPRAPRPTVLPRPLCLALLALLAGPVPDGRAWGGDDQARPGRELGLGEVRTLFRRVDADRDGQLALIEADHGGVAAAEVARFDSDRDGRLGLEEFVVARQVLGSASQRAVAPDLLAESTRIQAVWRMRRAGSGSQGPSERVDAARRPERPTDPVGEGRGVEPGPSGRGIFPRPASRSRGADKPGDRTAAEGGEAATDPTGPGLRRLQRVSGIVELQSGITLEDRARAAQELIATRMRERSGGIAARTATPSARSTGSVSAPGAQVPRGSSSSRATVDAVHPAPRSRSQAAPQRAQTAPPGGPSPTSRPPPPDQGSSPAPPPASGPGGARVPQRGPTPAQGPKPQRAGAAQGPGGGGSPKRPM